MRPQHEPEVIRRLRDRQKILEQLDWIEDCLSAALDDLPGGWFNEPDSEKCKANVEHVVDYVHAIRKMLGDQRPSLRTRRAETFAARLSPR